MRINHLALKSQIDAIMAEYPELLEDEDLRLTTIEAKPNVSSCSKSCSMTSWKPNQCRRPSLLAWMT